MHRIGVRGVFLQGGNLRIYLLIYQKNEACRGVEVLFAPPHAHLCFGIPLAVQFGLNGIKIGKADKIKITSKKPRLMEWDQRGVGGGQKHVRVR